MDPTEDLSARILLKHILVTEPPRTPVTRSDTQGESSSRGRSSKRQSNKDPAAQTPQSILRRSLKQKIHEGITRKSLPATKRRTASIVLKKTQTPAAASLCLSDGETPRHLLRNILQTEPVKSPVVHEKGPPEEQDLPSTINTVTKTHSSIELSGLDLTDVTISHAASTAKGLSRKRPRRSLNVTAFEKRLKDGDDAEEEEEADNLTSDHSSLSLSSSTSLSLKTPFVDVRTEKRGLQRRVSNRRKITEEEFGAAVNRREMGVMSSYMHMERDLSETTHSEGFTLGLSKLSEPDITTDIVNCNTALYDLPDAMTSSTSIVATQDKPTVMASQLQREVQEMEMEEEEEGLRKLETEMSVSVFPQEEEAAAEPENDECVSEAKLQEDVDEFEPQNKTAHDQQENAAVMSTSEELEDGVGSQTVDIDDRTECEEMEARTAEEDAADLHSEEAAEANDQFEGVQVALDPQVEEEDADQSQTEKDTADSQSEDAQAGSQSDEEAAALGSETNENEDEEEEDAAELQSKDVAAGSQSEDVEVASQSEKDEVVAESQSEDDHHEEREKEEELEYDLEHVHRRAHRSEGVLVVPMTEAGEELAEGTGTGWSGSKSKAHTDLYLNTSLEMRSQEGSQLHTGKSGWAEPSIEDQEDVSCPENDPEAGKENSLHPLQVTRDIKVSGHLSDLSPEGIPAQDADEKEQWEEEEDDDDDDNEQGEDFPSKTPAFVKEKRNFCLPDGQASPSVFRNIQASNVYITDGFSACHVSSSTSEAAAKPKQARPRKTRPSTKNTALPKAYLMSVFRHFAKTKVSADVYPVLNEIMDKFFGRLADDLETYAIHAKRKTIDIEDAKLLLKRQGYVNDKVPVEVLIEKYLRMEQRKLLIPIATSGNVVIPKKRR